MIILSEVVLFSNEELLKDPVLLHAIRYMLYIIHGLRVFPKIQILMSKVERCVTVHTGIV